MLRISFKAVCVGAAADMILSTLASALLAIAFILILHLTGTPSEPLDWALLQPSMQNSLLYSLQLIVGSACSVLAGFIAACVAGHDGLLNSALSSFASVLLGIYATAADKDPHQRSLHVLLLIASPLLGLLGGSLQRRRPARLDRQG